MNIIEACKKYKKIKRYGWSTYCYIKVRQGSILLYRGKYPLPNYHLTREDILANDWQVYRSLKNQKE